MLITHDMILRNLTRTYWIYDVPPVKSNNNIKTQASNEDKLNWMREYAEMHNYNYSKPDTKDYVRVFSELDPYGEENWD